MEEEEKRELWGKHGVFRGQGLNQERFYRLKELAFALGGGNQVEGCTRRAAVLGPHVPSEEVGRPGGAPSPRPTQPHTSLTWTCRLIRDPICSTFTMGWAPRQML